MKSRRHLQQGHTHSRQGGLRVLGERGVRKHGDETCLHSTGWELPTHLAHVEQAEESHVQAWQRSSRPTALPKTAGRAPKALLTGETPAPKARFFHLM